MLSIGLSIWGGGGGGRLNPKIGCFTANFNLMGSIVETKGGKRYKHTFSKSSFWDLFKNCLVSVAVMVIKVFGTKDNNFSTQSDAPKNECFLSF